MINIQNLIVPVDFSKNSRFGLEFAFQLALEKNLHVHVLHVVQTGYLKSLYQTSHIKMLEKEAEKHLEEFCSDYSENPYLESIKTSSGVPYQVILETANKVENALLAQSSHGWSTAEQQLIGSQAEKIIRRSKNPVLTLKAGRTPDSFRTVLLATDFSDTARQALQSALLFANIYKANLHLLHVVNRQIWYDAFLLTGFEFNVLEEQVYKQAESCLRDLLRDFVEEDITCDIHITRGAALEQIQYMANKLEADLIVLGTHGNTNAENVLIGSVAEKIARHAPCAVLTVARGPKQSIVH